MVYIFSWFLWFTFFLGFCLMDSFFGRYIRKDADSNIFKNFIEDMEIDCRFCCIKKNFGKNTLDFINKMSPLTTISNSASSISLIISKELVSYNKSLESLDMIQKLGAPVTKYM